MRYQSGFGNEHATEAVAGALPHGQNSPQRPPLGLYAEQLSGTPFTTPRAAQRRSWLYRIRPSADHPAYRPIERGLLRSGPFTESPPEPNRLRWDPLPLQAGDWLSSLVTLAGCGEPNVGGVAVHLYATKQSMTRVFYDADGELVFVPQAGALRLCTELGVLEVAPGEIAVVPRGVRFRVELLDAEARGYVGESYGPPLRLPELGPIGSNSLANARDFQYPVAWFEERGPTEVVQKFEGHLFSTTLDHSPLDVVAWHGTHAPYKYDLARFNTIGTVSFDHPDPSIFTVLTSPSEIAGTANMDFVIFPPRWMVAEHTFRPPWFHRNVMNELMGLVKGAYDAKAEGFVPGGASLHNCMSAHGPDAVTTDRAMAATLAPVKIDGTLAFMFETRLPLRPTKWAMESATRQPDYDACWRGFPRTFER